ncbi:MAG: carboxypeptidase-like regulatory domain-containing protein, partial [Terriglobia bacterium]
MKNLPCPRTLQTLLLWGLISCALTAMTLSQINTADLQGVITDPASAGIRAATVRVENRETGLVRETNTRESGDYLFLALPPGHYKVSVDAASFRPAVVEDVVLTIGQQAQ